VKLLDVGSARRARDLGTYTGQPRRDSALRRPRATQRRIRHHRYRYLCPRTPAPPSAVRPARVLPCHSRHQLYGQCGPTLHSRTDATSGQGNAS
jgi:hypothetical protein